MDIIFFQADYKLIFVRYVQKVTIKFFCAIFSIFWYEKFVKLMWYLILYDFWPWSWFFKILWSVHLGSENFVRLGFITWPLLGLDRLRMRNAHRVYLLDCVVKKNTRPLVGRTYYIAVVAAVVRMCDWLCHEERGVCFPYSWWCTYLRATQILRKLISDVTKFWANHRPENSNKPTKL